MRRTSTAVSGRAPCVQYALLEDSAAIDSDSDSKDHVEPFAICTDGRRRIQHVYRSTGHVVRLWVTAGLAPTDLKRFVIHYTGTAYDTIRSMIRTRKLTGKLPVSSSNT